MAHYVWRTRPDRFLTHRPNEPGPLAEARVFATRAAATKAARAVDAFAEGEVVAIEIKLLD